MKKNNLLYVLMSFLSFTLLFGSIYFIVTDDVMLGAILSAVSLFSIGAIFFLLRKQTYPKNVTQFIVPKEIHFEKEHDVISDEEPMLVPTIKEKEDSKAEERHQEENLSKSKDDFYEFNLIVNPNFDQNMIQFVSRMIDEDMFLESYNYKYTSEQVIEHGLVGENLYKYEFHPIPHITFHPDKKNDKIIKIKVGIKDDQMIDMGYVPQTDIEKVQELLTSITKIKAYLSGGTYNVVEKHESTLRKYSDPFIINIRLYCD